MVVGASSDPFDAFDHTFDHTQLQLAYCSLLAHTFSGFRGGSQNLVVFFLSLFHLLLQYLKFIEDIFHN